LRKGKKQVSTPRKHLDIPLRKLLHPEMGQTPEERAAWFHKMQETRPISFQAEYDLWEVFRYADIQRVLLEHETFSSEYVRIAGLPDVDDLGNTDPPRHQQLRTLVSKVFTPRSISQLAPRITAIVDNLLDKVIMDGHMDIARQFAFPLPVLMIAELLGIPAKDKDRFIRWSYQLMGAMPNPHDPNYKELTDYFREILIQREKDPRDDLLSALLLAEAAGEHLTRDEVIAIGATLLLAGHITTTMLITHAIHRFDRHPEIYDALRADFSLIPGALEEVLRYEFSMSNLIRLVKRDTTLGGQPMKKGQVVLAWVGAANFDEMVFPHSDQFDIRRSPNPHVTFGYGVHVCLGAPLARLEGKIAFERILERMQDIRCDAQNSARFMQTTSFIQSLPIFFAARTPLQAPGAVHAK
jgi:cytochrome P450